MDMGKVGTNIVWHPQAVEKQARARLKRQKPCIIWLTGLSGAGKSTIANALDQFLIDQGFHTYLLDGDNVRHGLNKDLGFSEADRIENIRRVGEVSRLFVDAGVIVLCSFISPFCADRQLVRELVKGDEFVEVYVKASVATCEQRDVKGLYKKARAGQIKNFTGIDSPYEAPQQPELLLDTESQDVDACVAQLVAVLRGQGYLGAF
ncbi:adenylyl-sulfate kinase [Pseudomonas sp. SORT22]|nr:adenylyl-sulfate kinase [Pseudomonas sp. SORT22]